MRDRLISFLKCCPPFYHFAQNSYWKVASLRANILGTKIQERYWRKRHYLKSSDWEDAKDWTARYWDSKSHPHRQLLSEIISHYSPMNILEVGSNCGPNLYLLARKNPQMKLAGVDINEEAIKLGMRLFSQEGISNVKLFVGKADELGQFSDKSFDIVFTDAVLMYIGPDKIKKVIKEVLRIARRVLILVEWHCENQNKDAYGLGIYHFGCWKRNYVNLLKQFMPKEKVHLTKIPKKLWPSENWQNLGYIIEVIL